MRWLIDLINSRLEYMEELEFLMLESEVDYPKMIEIKSYDEDMDKWKPIKSLLTNSSLNAWESKMKAKLPEAYRFFLSYKHFYRLALKDQNVEISCVPNILEKLTVQEDGFIRFAYFSGGKEGWLYFNTNVQCLNNDYPIFYREIQEEEEYFFFTDTFKKLVTSGQEQGNNFIDRQNEYYKRK